ncbi:MAG: CPBP family intramembrane metalloprotease [Planctomycetota bacterium]|nr:CPBP family intramembrane metalloprotease [Planctomycetota bacterium]
MGQQQDDFFREKNGLLIHFIIPYVIAVMIAALWVRLAQLPSLFHTPSHAILFVWSAVGLLTGIVVNRGGILLEGYRWYTGMVVWMKRMIRQALGPRVYFTDAMLIGIYSSVGEEAFFRGALQPWLIRWLSEALDSPNLGAFLGILGASVVFGLMHAPMVKELRPWTVMAVLMGVVFGALAFFSGSLMPAILAHFTINFLNLLRLNDIELGDEEINLAGPRSTSQQESNQE